MTQTTRRKDYTVNISPDMWESLKQQTDPYRPGVGRQVRVLEGKMKGKVGTVKWHGQNKLSSSWHYKTDAQLMLMDLKGREGFRILVDTGSEEFYIDADKVNVITDDVNPDQE